MRFLMMLLVLCGIGFAQNLKIEYDKFDKTTSYSESKRWESPDDIKLMLTGIVYLSKDSTVKHYNRFFFASTSERWRFLDTRNNTTLYYFCNNESGKMYPDKGTYDHTIGRGYVIEYLFFDISDSLLTEFSKCSDLAFKVSIWEFSPPESSRKAYSEYLDIIHK